MADVRERVAAEIEHIDRSLLSLPAPATLARLSALELAGVAAVLHGLYGGVENLLKLLLVGKGVALPEGPAWHRELLDLAAAHGLLSQPAAEGLRRHLAFRHFFLHAYPVHLRGDRMELLVETAPTVYAAVRADIAAATSRISGA